MFLRVNSNTHIPVTEAEIDRDFPNIDMARIFVLRSLFDESVVERGETEVALVDEKSDSLSNARFGGVLRDIDRQGALSEIIVESTERYAKDAELTSGNNQYSGTSDDVIIKDAVDAVSQLSRGTIETVYGAISMLFSHKSQARKIRATADSTGAEIRYNPNGSVDYVSRLGSDKTGTTISPDAQNIKENFRGEKNSGDADITHLRVLGAGEGVSQTEANLIPQDDPYDYEGDGDYKNVNRYSASHWSSGDRKKFRSRSNTQHTDVSSLVSWGESIINDVQQEEIEVRTTIEGLDVSLGDSFHVEYSEEQIDDNLRVVKLIESINSKGTQYEVTMSNRRSSRIDSDLNQQVSIENSKTALQGTPVTLNSSGGRQPVDSSNPYVMRLYYPNEVKYIHRLNVRIIGLPYRAYSAGASVSGLEHAHGVDLPFSNLAHSHPFSFSTRSDVSSRNLFDTYDTDIVTGTSATPVSSTITVGDGGSGDCHVSVAGSYRGSVDAQTVNIKAVVDTNVVASRRVVVDQSSWFTGDLIIDKSLRSVGDVTIKVEANGEDVKNVTAGTIVVPNHDHTVSDSDTTDQTTFTDDSVTSDNSAPESDAPPNPGIVEVFNGSRLYPSNISVEINGTAIDSGNISFESGTDDGTGEFTAVADIKADSVSLSEGQSNQINVKSDSLGHCIVFVEGDVYRQINGDG